MHTIRLFGKIVKYQFLAEIEYPGAYVAGIVAQWISYGVQMLMIFLMVWNFGSLVGWLPEEIVFLFAIILLTYAIAATFVFNTCMNLDKFVINGTLDESLIRPMRPFVYLIATNVNIGYISHITLTTAALVICIWQLGITWSILQWLWLVVILISGAVITGCLMLIASLPAMRTRSQSPFFSLFWESHVFNRYPISIYSRFLQMIFTAVIPLAFVNYYPVQVLLTKQEGFGAPVTMWLSPLVATVLICITILIWTKVSKHYESAGT